MRYNLFVEKKMVHQDGIVGWKTCHTTQATTRNIERKSTAFENCLWFKMEKKEVK